MPKASIDRAAFAAMAAATGLSLSEKELSELYEAYGYVEAMTARLRSAKRPLAAEPAGVFKPAG